MDKIRMMMEEFEVEQTGERMPGVTVLLEGQFRQILDILMEQKGYENYIQLLRDALMDGIGNMMGVAPEDRK